MQLYLMRHGISENSEAVFLDRDRPLTSAGMEKTRRQAVYAKQAGWAIDHLRCSPYVRARQTAALFAEALGVPYEETPLLTPGCTLDDLAEVVAALPQPNRVMIVSHQPALGRLIFEMTGSHVRMRPGAVALIEIARIGWDGGTLSGFYDPDFMARLGR